VNRADGDDRHIERRDVARHDGLQRQHDLRADDDRIDRLVRHRAVPAAPGHGNDHRIR